MKTAFAALVVACVLGCAGHKESQSDQIAKKVDGVRQEVARVVAEAARARNLLSSVDRFEAELQSFDRTVLTFQRSLQALNARPDAARAEFAELIDRFEAERRASRGRILRIHYSFLANTTADEWRSIAKREAEVLELDDPAALKPEAQ